MKKKSIWQREETNEKNTPCLIILDLIELILNH